jgi:hypothetical protein
MHVVNYCGAGPLEYRQLATQWICIAALTVQPNICHDNEPVSSIYKDG